MPVPEDEEVSLRASIRLMLHPSAYAYIHLFYPLPGHLVAVFLGERLRGCREVQQLLGWLPACRPGSLRPRE